MSGTGSCSSQVQACSLLVPMVNDDGTMCGKGRVSATTAVHLQYQAAKPTRLMLDIMSSKSAWKICLCCCRLPCCSICARFVSSSRCSVHSTAPASKPGACALLDTSW